MFLFGGGFALAEASKRSGLSDWVGGELRYRSSIDQNAGWLINDQQENEQLIHGQNIKIH
jgi:hypothetical protein